MMRRRSKLLLLPLYLMLGLNTFSLTMAETGTKLLTPKRSAQKPNPKSTPELDGPLQLRPKNLMEREEEDWGPASPLEQVSFTLLFGTPLGYENFYEKRFQALTDLFLFSFPLSRMTKRLFLHLEAGPGFSYARLKFSQPTLSYTHMYITVPAHLRLIYTSSKSLHFEIFAGALARIVEYDSRDTTDGGTHLVKNDPVFSPDGGVGISYVLTPALKMRLNAGYLFLTGGLELTL